MALLPRSPYINLIALLWEELDRSKPYSTSPMNFLLEQAANIPHTVLEKLVNRMRKMIV